MLTKHKLTLKHFFFILATFSFALCSSLALKPQPGCELIEIDQAHPFYTAHYRPREISEAIRNLQQRKHLTESKAKGVIGELAARDCMEKNIKYKGKPLVSIFTLFSHNGCTVTPYLRSAADQGIDDIFVILNNDGKTINRNYNPIFHEAKFNGQCKLKLNVTETICSQLSFQWIDYHIGQAHQRAVTGLDICFGSHNKVEIKPCGSCERYFLEEASWLKDKLQSGSFHRTASVLCANGVLKLYEVDANK